MRTLNMAILCLFVVVLFTSRNLMGQSSRIEGQVSGWISVTDSEPPRTQMGIRYIPNLYVSQTIGHKYSLNAEFSADVYGTGLMQTLDHVDFDGKTKPYRLWFRFSGTQFEARLGLQKINFGSASLLRPLMWFDRIDARDPLQLTDGVYGALFRYYFLNNANIWLWGLYGNDETKGWEIVPSDDETVEYGGRFQYPLWTGEIAATYHHRKMDLEKGLNDFLSSVSVPVPNEMLSLIDLSDIDAPENRFGVDGKWDMEIGFWLEAVLIHHDIDLFPELKYRRFVNVGGDYTFGLGNGLHALGEHLILEISEEPFGSGERFQFSALSLNYPVGLVDNVTGVLYYDWENESWYRFVNWQRTYDTWRFYLMAFWNPEQFQIYQGQEQIHTFAGKGIQVMAVYNH
jgi:hypothetical protein